MNDFVKFLIIFAIIVLAALGLYHFVLPDSTKAEMKYTTMQVFDKDTFAEIQKIQALKVLGFESSKKSYQEILEANGTSVYWTYTDDPTLTVTAEKKIEAYADGVTITIGENDDGGAYDDAQLRLEFLIYSDNRYDLTAYMNGIALSRDERDMLLKKMIERS